MVDTLIVPHCTTCDAPMDTIGGLGADVRFRPTTGFLTCRACTSVIWLTSSTLWVPKPRRGSAPPDAPHAAPEAHAADTSPRPSPPKEPRSPPRIGRIRPFHPPARGRVVRQGPVRSQDA